MALTAQQIAHINTLHEEAMNLSEHADFNVQEAKKMYRQAYEKALEAADLTPASGEGTEPTRSTMYRSAMFLAVQAEKREDAIQVAQKLLSFTGYVEYILEAQEILKDYGVEPITNNFPKTDIV